MDRRQAKTRQAVFDAFAVLLEKKKYSKITVQEIIDEANIGRSTFYSHFETKDELLRALCSDIFEHVFDDNPSKENTHDFSSGEDDIKGKVTHILYHLQDNVRYIKRLLSSESGEMFIDYFKEYLEDVFRGELKNTRAAIQPNVQTKIPEEYLLNHIVCDFAESVRWWMKNQEYSPEDISGFFFYTTSFDAGR